MTLTSKTSNSLKKSTSKDKELIEPKSKGPAIREVTRSVASILVALSGLLLLSDKVFSFKLEDNFHFQDTKTFIWVVSQSLSPLLLAFAANFKPYRLSYIIPAYLYFIQLYWVFNPSIQFDDALLHLYAIGFVIVFIFLVRLINIRIYKARFESPEEIGLLKNILDLFIKADAKKSE